MNPSISITASLANQIKDDILLRRLYPEFLEACSDGILEDWLIDHPEYFDRIMSYANHSDIQVKLNV